MGVGLVPVTRAGNTWTLRTARAPEARPASGTRAEIARMLGLPDGAVCDEPLWVSTASRLVRESSRTSSMRFVGRESI